MMRRRSTTLPARAVLITLAVLLLCLVAASTVAAATPPTNVQLALQAKSTNCQGGCLTSNTIVLGGSDTEQMSATATPASGTTITSVAFQYSQPGSDPGVWTTFSTASTSPYSASFFPAAFNASSGTIDLRAEVTDSDGGVADSVISSVVYVNYGDTYVGMQQVPSVVEGSLTLLAAPAAPYGNYNANGNAPDTVSFLVSPAGQDNWTTIATVPAATDANGNPINAADGSPEYTTALDTTTLADGHYDFEVTAEDAYGDVYVGNEVDDILVDNTPPTVTLNSPGSQLTGVVNLSATATDPGGSGIAGVRFEYSPAGANDWSTITVVPSAPFSVSFDTRGLANGSYDLRAVATDVAGLTTTSAVVSGVTVTNAAATANPDSLAVTDYVVPATDVTILGAVAGSSDDETWAYGYTTAPPAVMNGSALPYTAPTGVPQFVLLRYEDGTGWQIADVLRNADGSAYVQGGTVTHVTGEMAPSGEAWLMVAQSVGGVTSAAMFHRQPDAHDGEFVLDASATASLQPMLTNFSSNGAPVLTVAEDSDGNAYGLLVNPGQTAKVQQLKTAQGASASVATSLAYGALATNGTWTLDNAPVPTTYTPAAGELKLQAGSLSGPDSGWAVFSVQNTAAEPLLLGSFAPPSGSSSTGWSFVSSTGLDALDLTLKFAPPSTGAQPQVQPQAIAYTSEGVWIGADLVAHGGGGNVVALYDPTTGHVVNSWCAAAVLNLSAGCAEPLDGNHPAAVPNAVFETGSGPVALAQGAGAIDVYAYGAWTAVPVAGFGVDDLQPGFFTSPSSGWLSGTYSLGQITPSAPNTPLASWPEASTNTLTSVAVPPGGAGTGTSGALAVGLDGTALHYDATAGWLVDAVPRAAQAINLFGVAFDGAGRAVAVGGLGTILNWNGSAWSRDPQSAALTTNQLNAVAFASDGQGWAVGTFGTILHYDGTAWSQEQIDSADAGVDVTSVAVAGSQVLAVAGGNLIVRNSNGTWSRFDATQLPASSASTSGTFTVVSGLPDGGAVIGGDSEVLIRQS
jgi:hypothetical protein